MSRITDKIAQVLRGELEYEELDSSGRSVLSLHIYLAAKKIMAHEDKAIRRKMFETLPMSLQPIVKLEAIKMQRAYNKTVFHISK